MEKLAPGWFTEVFGAEPTNPDSDCFTGQAFSLAVERVLHNRRSEYQDILVFESKHHGNVLALDGVINCTERDEFAYHEMLTHVPMCSHPNPKKVLIIGGGDGGVLREVVKHDCVEMVTLCEIDEAVIDVSERFLPKMTTAFEHPKARINIGDGLEFMQKHKNEFDIIITDSTDIDGPARALFGKSYFGLVKDALNDSGILVSQVESFWTSPSLLSGIFDDCRSLYPSVEYGYFSVPTYTSGTAGLLICSKQESDLKKPSRTLADSDLQKMQLRYYTPEVHSAAFVLPKFAKNFIATPTNRKD